MKLNRQYIDGSQFPLHLAAQGGAPVVYVDCDVTTDLDVRVEDDFPVMLRVLSA